MNHVFIVSDGTGRTAEMALNAALVQFPNVAVEPHVKQNVRTRKQIIDIVKEAHEAKAFIIHTLVTEKDREIMVRQGRIHNVETIDVMGPLLARLSLLLSDSPTEKPGLFYKLNREYFVRIDCMQFAFNHDDGQRAHELDKAEIVLVGVSRTFKTPLSIYLAFKGWNVANVPIVYGIDPPEELYRLDRGKVIGLNTFPTSLSTLRQARQDYLGGQTGDYADLDFVRRELSCAQDLFAKQDWPVINVTNKPIEEIASELLAVIRKLNPPELFLDKT